MMTSVCLGLSPRRGSRDGGRSRAFRSAVRLEIGCPWCLTAVGRVLARHWAVRSLTVGLVEGWLEVRGDLPVGELLALIDRMGRRVQVAADGQAVVVPASVELKPICPHHGTPTPVWWSASTPAPTFVHTGV